MLFVIGLIRKGFDTCGEIIIYNLLDTLSESHMAVTPIMLKHIILNCTEQVINAEIRDDKIVLKDWVENITVRLSGPNRGYQINDFDPNTKISIRKCDLIVLNKDGITYKVAGYKGELYDFGIYELEEAIKSNRMANCSLEGMGKSSKIKGNDIYEITTNKELEKSIAIKYEAFLAKAAMLGYGKVSFTYKIENGEVILKKYTGLSKNIIIPSFITAIRNEAFDNAQIETLNLNEGLKFIGTAAFAPRSAHNGLEFVEIPSTVEIIAPRAFNHNNKLFNSDRSINTHRFKLRNNKTLVMTKLG